MKFSAELAAPLGLFLVALHSCTAFAVFPFNPLYTIYPRPQIRHHYLSTTLFYREDDEREALPDPKGTSPCKQQLLRLLNEVPSSAPTPRRLTIDILNKVEEMESLCPTPDDEVLGQLGGNWELQWTAQDRESREWRRNPMRAYINPLENQSYSNNPDGGGRANPFLPRRIQDRLERLGVLRGAAETRSSQSVDLNKRRVRNVVAFEMPTLLRQALKVSLTVDIKFQANESDQRRVDVKFDQVRLVIPTSRLDINLPLGPIGPSGWLRTGYIDDNMRITRGHKGSVFILTRQAKKKRAEV